MQVGLIKGPFHLHPPPAPTLLHLSLGGAVQHSSAVDGIKINDDLRPPGLELPADNTAGVGGGGNIHVSSGERWMESAR